MPLRDNIRIMVVDDTAVSRALIVQSIEAMGVKHIQHAKDGATALKALATKPAHLVVSDFNMPGMDGLQLLETLRRNPATRKVGFILVTGRADKTLVTKGKSLGMNNFIAKPFTPQGMRKCIEDVVGPV